MWIELSEFNIKIFLPLIFPIFNRINDLTREIYKKNDGDNKLFKNFRYFLCYTFSFIPLIIITNSQITKLQIFNR